MREVAEDEGLPSQRLLNTVAFASVSGSRVRYASSLARTKGRRIMSPLLSQGDTPAPAPEDDGYWHPAGHP